MTEALRQELSARLVGVQADQEAALVAIRASGSGAEISEAENRLNQLDGLLSKLETASPSSLASLRAEVTAIVAAAQLATGQAKGNGRQTEVQEAAQAAREQVRSFQKAMFEDRIFDPYLHFGSAEDERAYREREARRQAEIEKAQAEGTPQGHLRAVRTSIEQMNDAGAHGADRSPAFAGTLDGLTRGEKNLSASLADRGAPSPAPLSADPVDAANAAVSVDPSVLQSFRARGIVVAEVDQPSHGLSGSGVKAADVVRTT